MSVSLLAFAKNVTFTKPDTEAGVRVIKPGEQTPEQNVFHEQYCRSIGGKDITNKGTSTLSAGAKDGIVCEMPLNSPHNASVGIVNSDGSFSPSDSKEFPTESSLQI